jgi:ppGpp synthetase/RelA/SpoT-type nucleotidyltranferase
MIATVYSRDIQAKYKLLAIKTHELISSILSQNNINIHSITSREKDPESLQKKILDKGYSEDNPLDQVTDLAGVRVITYFPNDVDKIVPLIENEFDIDKSNSIDKRKTTDPSFFGYASVHLIVEFSPKRLRLPEYKQFKGLKCEIQVRTILQHAWAEIEHDIVYKSNEDIPFELRRKFASLAGLLEVADREFETLRLEEIKLRNEIQQTIQKKNLAIPIDLESLTFYLEKYHKETIKNNQQVSRLNRLIQSRKISTLEELNKILTPDAIKAVTKRINKLKTACKSVDKCLLKYALVIGDNFKLSDRDLSRIMICPLIRDPEGYVKERKGIAFRKTSGGKPINYAS